MTHSYQSKLKKQKAHGHALLWILKLISYLDKERKIIILTGFDGEKYITMSYKARCIICEKIHAPIYWNTKTGDVILEENVQIGSENEGIYIKSWEYYNKRR